ncbi:AcrR family transcriptional regulator [Haemophilus paracuniculus]|uniref:AcrR family transcriptional regulator n=2 Tax=Haemophilus paracuniculus TaxID=734 RepID=A0A1T0AUV5_9PAST|nr:AcrR family transcriptional regulator [Haemophilus paracuniculus]
MNRANEPKNPVALRILTAAEVLMAKDGVQNLSTHKIAKAAGMSVGTIYLHFKDKEDLLDQLVYFLFDRFHQHIVQFDDPALPLFERYRKLWWGYWQFLQENPDMVMSIHQYESLPRFHEMLKCCFNEKNLVFNQLFQQATEQKLIADLPNAVLFSLTIKVALNLAYLQIIEQMHYADAILEETILRTWKAISI